MRMMVTAGVSLLIGGWAAAGPVDGVNAGADAEAAVRNADAAWLAAAKARNLDAWMAFYTEDVVLMPPDLALSRGRPAARPAIAELLALPQLTIGWHAIQVEVAGSGEMAYEIGAYELGYVDARGTELTERGKLLEIWKKQPDGSWKCAVDTWNSDGRPTDKVSSLAPAGSAAPVVPAAPVAPAAPGVPAVKNVAPAAPVTASGPLTPQELAEADYGEKPEHYAEAVRAYFRKRLRDPDTAQYGEITAPVRGYTTTVSGMILARETRHYGWTVKATVNAKNSFGGYVGFKTYTFLFRGEKLIQTMAPLSEDEVK